MFEFVIIFLFFFFLRRLPDVNLEKETCHYLAEYFMYFDNQKTGNGFAREDALELVDAAGFDESAEPCKDFLMRAPG